MYTDCKANKLAGSTFMAYFNSRMYTDCKSENLLAMVIPRTYFNSRMYTDCKGHGINPRPYPAPRFPFANLIQEVH